MGKQSAYRLLLVALAVVILTAGVAFADDITGPSSSQSPYVVPAIKGVVAKSVLTVGDSVNNKAGTSEPYRMVGIPDGLGAFDNGDGTFTLLMNHELGATVGAVRAHGAKGAFVSRWTIDKESLRVLNGEDLIKSVGVWNGAGWDYKSGVAISRLCSADLPLAGAFYNPRTGKGYNGRLFMNGEESGAEGLAYAHALDGVSYQLPWLGRFSWENSIANPNTGDRTVVVGLDDSGSGQVYVYVGEKQAVGASPVELAGLTNGKLYGVKVEGFPFEDPANGIPSGTPFTLFDLGNVANTTGATLQSASRAAGVTEFQRPEDGAWDTLLPSDFYFVSTASFSGKSRLWKLDFHDPGNPTAGGTIDMLLDGAEGPKMMDNMTITNRRQIFIQEDPGNQPYLAKIWRYDVDTDALRLIAELDPSRFAPGAPSFLTQDEESSGIIPVFDILGEGKFLLDVQAHYPSDAELVEGGQLLVLQVPPGKK